MTDVWRNSDMDGQECRIYAADGIVRFDLDRPELALTPQQARLLSTQLLLAVTEAVQQADDGWWDRGLDRLLAALDVPQDGVRCQVRWFARNLSCLSGADDHVDHDGELLALCADHAALVREGVA